jgi:hypothetical protein
LVRAAQPPSRRVDGLVVNEHVRMRRERKNRREVARRWIGLGRPKIYSLNGCLTPLGMGRYHPWHPTILHISKGVFGRLGELRYSHLNLAQPIICCLVDRLGPSGLCE